MVLVNSLIRLLSRFRHPASLPEDLALDLGIFLPNSLTYDDLIRLLSHPRMRPKRLKRFMDRQRAEAAFQHALKKEKFKTSSLFSYYFSKGWLVFALHFDQQERLRRIYIQCPGEQSIEGFDISLNESVKEPVFGSLHSSA